MPEGQLIEFSHVTKRFGDVTAVDDLSARIEPGTVTGFLGPNGAGKTTSLCILLGQVRATAGTATIGGQEFSQIRQPLRTVGFVMEDTGYRPRRTALRQLTVTARANGIPLSRIDEVLALVGLEHDADAKIGTYSLGMRQRLSVATALLGDPGALVFDEPANGLDPEGIRWMRLLLRRLADEGRTVLVSSHVISEIERIADHVLVLSHGRLLFDGSIDELADPTGGPVVVDSDDRAGLARALAAAELDYDLLRSGLTVRGSDPTTVGAAAAEAGIALTSLQRRSPSLEDIYFERIRTGFDTVTPSAEPAAAPGESADDSDDAVDDIDSAAIAPQPEEYGSEPHEAEAPDAADTEVDADATAVTAAAASAGAAALAPSAAGTAAATFGNVPSVLPEHQSAPADDHDDDLLDTPVTEQVPAHESLFHPTAPVEQAPTDAETDNDSFAPESSPATPATIASPETTEVFLADMAQATGAEVIDDDDVTDDTPAAPWAPVSHNTAPVSVIDHVPSAPERAVDPVVEQEPAPVVEQEPEPAYEQHPEPPAEYVAAEAPSFEDGSFEDGEGDEDDSPEDTATEPPVSAGLFPAVSTSGSAFGPAADAARPANTDDSGLSAQLFNTTAVEQSAGVPTQPFDVLITGVPEVTQEVDDEPASDDEPPAHDEPTVYDEPTTREVPTVTDDPQAARAAAVSASISAAARAYFSEETDDESPFGRAVAHGNDSPFSTSVNDSPDDDHSHNDHS
ncbi:ATP-binding cassette domain-containing protein [Microbacterium sp. YY-01]|uniref:ABC transporter ATP-binding protein n=1 Tax=Microbacterium sp. YY-01 TaxID=3421634 RepID=UPI003D165350